MISKIDNLKKERSSIIKSYNTKEIKDTNIDYLSKNTLDIQYVIIKDIIDETPDTKSFILVPDNEKTFNLEPFMAGQYISIMLDINDTYTTRAYSLSSSPKDNFYRITVKRIPDGLVSNYMLDNLNINDHLTISKPEGDFTYNYIRDEENIIAIAGGSGITPFMSLAKYIIDANLNVNLTVFYAVKKEEDIIFKNEINSINNPHVKFVITLTREENSNYLHGHFTKEMFNPYFKEFNTIFMCGPKTLYQSMNEILTEFDIPRKNVHYENFYNDYTPEEVKTYELKVILKNDLVISKCYSNKTLLRALEEAGIKAPSLCRVGMCGFCKSILLEGKIKMIGASLVKAEVDNDYIHPCVTYPESDIVLRLDI